jgi:uncharacterized membrane protein
MNPVLVKEAPARAKRSVRVAEVFHFAVFVLFLFLFGAFWANLALPSHPWDDSRWLGALFVLLAVATTLTALARQLPAQNVALAATLIGVIAGAAQTLGALTAIPFGPYVYGGQFGPLLFYPLPWAAPLLWVVAILNSRGVARLIMRPWRKTRAYGIWVVGLTTVLVVLLDFGLEPVATLVKHYWFWNPTKLALTYYGAPGVNFVGWAVTALLILAFATPSLISKKHGRQPVAYHPLLIWLLLEFLLASGAAAHQLWPAAFLCLVPASVVAVFAVRGATW